MTGWTIEAGYQYDADPDDVAEALVAALGDISPASVSKRSGIDLDFVKGYLDPAGCALRTRGDADTDRPFVSIVASGGGSSRFKKEACARGICMILMEELHDLGFNVTVRCS